MPTVKCPTLGVLASTSNIFLNEEGGEFGECLSGTDCDRGNIPPFIAYTFCQKDANLETLEIPKESVLHSPNGCTDGWSIDSDSKGSFIIGAGIGNLDSNGDALKTYTYGETGGKKQLMAFMLILKQQIQGTLPQEDLEGISECLLYNDPYRGDGWRLRRR